jgi:hypothetical protein
LGSPRRGGTHGTPKALLHKGKRFPEAVSSPCPENDHRGVEFVDLRQFEDAEKLRPGSQQKKNPPPAKTGFSEDAFRETRELEVGCVLELLDVRVESARTRGQLCIVHNYSSHLAQQKQISDTSSFPSQSSLRAMIQPYGQ